MIKRIIDKFKTFYYAIKMGYSGYRRKLIYLSLFGFLATTFEGIGINAAIPLLYYATGKPVEGTDKVTELLMRFFNFFHLELSIELLLIVITLMFIFKFIVLSFLQLYKRKVSFEYQDDKRNKLFSSTLNASWPYLMQMKQGQVDTYLLTNIQRNAATLEQLSEVLVSFVTIGVFFVLAVYLSFYTTFFALIIGIISFFVYKPVIYKIRKMSYVIESANRRLAHYVNEKVAGMKSVKAMNVESQIVSKAADLFTELKEVGMKISFYRIISSNIMQPIGIITVLLIFAFFYKQPDYNFAYFGAILYLMQKMFTSALSLQASIVRIGESYPFLFKTISFAEMTNKNREPSSGRDSFEFKNNIEFKHVGFSYPGSEIFSDLNFTINKGEMVGFAGPSGAGKTTIVDLLLRLFPVKSGEIIIDGKNIEKISLEDWRKNIGYVSQDIFLLNDTIEDNIKFYDENISEKDIISAAISANIYDFIMKTPDKFRTQVGERGVNMSAGQRQRLVIARILARKPKILIFDEATSSLDAEAEKEIKRVIKNLKGEITTIIVAHRLSNLLDADRIAIVDKGTIIETGSPDELLKNINSYFYKNYNINK